MSCQWYFLRHSTLLCLSKNLSVPHLFVSEPSHFCQALHFAWREVPLHAKSLNEDIHLSLWEGCPEFCFSVIYNSSALLLWGIFRYIRNSCAASALIPCNHKVPLLLHQGAGHLCSVWTPPVCIIKVSLHPGSGVCLGEASFSAAGRTPWIYGRGNKLMFHYDCSEHIVFYLLKYCTKL